MRLSFGCCFQHAGVAGHSFLHRSFLLQSQTLVCINLTAAWWGKTAGARGWLVESGLVCDSCVLHFYFCRAILMECVAMGTVTSQGCEGSRGSRAAQPRRPTLGVALVLRALPRVGRPESAQQSPRGEDRAALGNPILECPLAKAPTAGHRAVLRDAPGCCHAPGMLWDAPGCSGMLPRPGDAPGCSGMLGDAPGCCHAPGMLQDAAAPRARCRHPRQGQTPVPLTGAAALLLAPVSYSPVACPFLGPSSLSDLGSQGTEGKALLGVLCSPRR